MNIPKDDCGCMENTARVLDDLIYIMRMVMIEATGEAKYELYNLINNMKKEDGYKIEKHQEVLDDLEAAQEHYRGSDYRAGHSMLSSVMADLQGRMRSCKKHTDMS